MKYCENVYCKIAKAKNNAHGNFGNKAKRRISKRVFKKTKHVIRVRIWGLEIFAYREIWRVLFSWNTRFEIRPLALLLTTSSNNWLSLVIYKRQHNITVEGKVKIHYPEWTRSMMHLLVTCKSSVANFDIHDDKLIYKHFLILLAGYPSPIIDMIEVINSNTINSFMTAAVII